MQPNNQLNTTANVQLSESTAGDDVKVAVGLGFISILLDGHGVSNVLEFGFGPDGIFSGLATETAEQPAGLLFTAHLDEPSWGLWEVPAGTEEDE